MVIEMALQQIKSKDTVAIKGRERADEMAKRAVGMPTGDPKGMPALWGFLSRIKFEICTFQTFFFQENDSPRT